MDEANIVVPASDGIELQVYRWAPQGTPRGVVQLQHGLAEHAGRYQRFGTALTRAGYLVYAPDGRGSGRTANGDYGNWGASGWPGWVDDLDRLGQRIRQDQPGLPVVLMGHSMGSFAAQQYVLDHSADLAGLVLSGTGDVTDLVPALASPEGGDLTAFNAPFPHRTGYEWLSRDEAEVDAYVADPASGWTAPPFGGIETLLSATDPARLAQVRHDLPVLLVSGSDDPVGGGEGRGVLTVAQRYRDAGLTDVTTTLYPQARHEVLNETNRDQVTADILAFLDRVVGR